MVLVIENKLIYDHTVTARYEVKGTCWELDLSVVVLLLVCCRSQAEDIIGNM